VHDLPLSEKDKIRYPQYMLLRFPKSNTVDIGALCYLEREETTIFSDAKKRRGRFSGRKVNVNSLHADRKIAVRKLIRHISDDLLYSGRRPETVRDAAARFIPFMDWADKNHHQDALNNVNKARLAFREYVRALRERVNVNSISVNGAARQQATVLKLLQDFFHEDSFSHGINLIRTNLTSKISTSPPDDNSQSEILSLCEYLFESIVSFVTEFRPYPYQLNLPRFVCYPKNRMWIFPTTTWFKHYLKKDSKSFAYNYNDGRVFTFAELTEIVEISDIPENQIKNAINRSKKQIDKANADQYDIHRLHQGMNALNYFVILFLAETGMNWAQLVNLTWSDNYTVESVRQLFRTIKWRSNGKEVSFELPSSFMPKFKKFLLLRKYLLQEFECEWLFFQRGCKRTSEPTQIKALINHTYKTLKKIYPPLKPISSRKWRAAKSDWLIRNTDPATTALILQNTERTVLASYIAGSEQSQIEEVSNFLNEVSRTVVSKDTKISGGMNQSLGTCEDFGKPLKIDSYNNIVVNCKNTDGCLFCEKFKVHADENDTRKLISCRYCIQQTAHLSPALQHQETMSIVIERINSILDEISKRDRKLVELITEEVEKFGELDPFWARKFEMLSDLDLIK
jgi:integrase